MVTPSDLSFDATGRVLPATSTVVMLAADRDACLFVHLKVKLMLQFAIQNAANRLVTFTDNATIDDSLSSRLSAQS